MAGARTSSARWILLSLAALAAAFSFAATPALAADAAITLTTSDPLEQNTVGFTVAGSSETSRFLFVTVVRDGGCAPRASEQSSGTSLRGGSPAVGPGTFSVPGNFIPSRPAPYRLCAWLTDSFSATPAAVAELAFVVRAGRGSAAIGLATPDPLEQNPVAFSITGSSEVDRFLFVTVVRDGGCAPRASEQSSGTSLRGGSPTVGPGSFTVPASFIPSQPGSYRLCAWLTEAFSDTPAAIAELAFVVRAGRGSLQVPALAASVIHVRGRDIGFSISGSSEVGRSLFVTAVRGGGCAPRASAQASGTSIRSGSPLVGPGMFTVPLRFVPSEAGNHRICAWLTADFSATPVATFQLPLRVQARPGREVKIVVGKVPRFLPSIATRVRLSAFLSSAAGKPSGRCAFDRKSGPRFITAAVVRFRAGAACKARIRPAETGFTVFRIRYLPDPGWQSVTGFTKRIRVRS